jgi:hypothetical protein
MIAALYVAERGCYTGLAGVDPWPESRDARLYAGPWPVVAHPPCERWGRSADGGSSARVKRVAGDDGGCFEAALQAVRRFGGVLEHPEASRAWPHFKLISPPRSGAWVAAGDGVGWTCCVEQGHYGHPGRKATWLYAVGADLPSLRWGSSATTVRRGRFALSPDLTPEQRRRAIKTGIVQRLSKNQRKATPIAFRDLLLDIARSASARLEAA